jgi:hypothetical protein
MGAGVLFITGYSTQRYHSYHANKNCQRYKLLGILLDEILSLDFHVNYLCKNIYRALCCIKQAKKIFQKYKTVARYDYTQSTKK